MPITVIKIFLRASIAFGFLSATADRLGWWGPTHSVWGNWQAFLDYTQLINPWFPENLIPAIAVIATAAEVVLGICLLLGFRTELAARLSGWLLLTFGLAMAFSSGIKVPLDYSVFSASAAAFGLSLIKEKRWEVDNLISLK